MKLRRLTLTNFKGARSFELLTLGMDVTVFGANFAGKSTLADAWFWLLFGKDSRNQATVETIGLKTHDERGVTFHNLDHTVEAELETDCGTLVLTRTLREKYEKKRGSVSSEFTGHTTDYFINGVPAKEKDFDARIAELCEEDRFRELTDTTFFNGDKMPWEKRRRKLLDICGDITTEDVIATNRELEELPKILAGRKLEDHKAIIESRRKAINEELQRLPIRIDEATRSMPVAPASTLKDCETALATHRDSLRQLQERRAIAAAGGEVAEKKVAVRTIESDLTDIATRLRSEANEAREKALSATRQKDVEISGAESTINQLRGRVSQAASEKDRLEPQRQRLLDQFNTERDKGFIGVDACPSCGQALPADRVQAAVEEFNQAKSKRLGEIQTDGKAIRGRIDELAGQIEGWQVEITNAESRIAGLRSEKAAIAVPEPAQVDFATNAEYAAKAQERLALLEQITKLQEGSGSVLEEVDGEIRTIEVRIGEVETVAARFRQRDELETRIEELKRSEKTLAQEFEKLEHELHLIEEFIRTKVFMLTERINGRFSQTRWKLFEEQINGGLKECCTACNLKGTAWSALSTSERITVGLDVINTLADYHGFAPPVFIDNKEAITLVPQTRGQQIRLQVSADDTTLRIETFDRAA